MTKPYVDDASWDQLQERRRPGFLAIRDELVAKRPSITASRAEAEAKTEWHRRNPGNGERRLG